MAAGVTLGLDATLKIDDDEIKNCKDLTVNLETAEADVTTRDNNGWRATVGTLIDATIEFQMVNTVGDTAFATVLGLLKSREPCKVEISDAGGTLTLACTVTAFNINQSLEEAVTADVTLRPTQSTSIVADNTNANGGGGGGGGGP